MGEVAAAEAAAACQACGTPEPHLGCWLCGYRYLAAARAEFEDELARDAVAVEAEFARIAARCEVEDRVAELEAWIGRLRTVLDGYERGNGWGRAVELLADLLARLAAARTSTRGRPPKTHYVGAVMAVGSDYRTGRRSMEGRERTAWLAGCSDRTVYDAWRLVVELRWAVRTRVGGRNSLERRIETGRPNDRAEHDLVPLNESSVGAATRAGYVPQALGVLGELLGHAGVLLGQALDELDELRARTATITDWPERVRRAQLRRAVAHLRDTITDPLPAALLTANICRPHPVSRGEYVSSCLYWGLHYSAPTMIHSAQCGDRPSGRSLKGASRSPARAGRIDLGGCGSPGATRPPSPRLDRPRTGHATCPESHVTRPKRRPTEWADWASPLARRLVRLWPWLATEPVQRVAATLGARLGPAWTAESLVHFAMGRCGWTEPDEVRAPLGLLAALLDDVLTRDDVEPPHPARRTVEARRRASEDRAEAKRGARQARAAELDARDAAAADERAGVGAGREAALAAVRQAGAASAAAQRERAARLADVEAATLAAAVVPERGEDDCWPPVAQPGSGRPPT